MSHPNGLRDRVKGQLRDAAADAEQIADINHRVRELEAALVDRGLSVSVAAPAITVLNPAARGAGGQTVSLCQTDEGLTWYWHWHWPALPSAERGVSTPSPELDPMCPAGDIETAARRIASVLRLARPELADDISDV
jgi:hypothetical protein